MEYCKKEGDYITFGDIDVEQYKSAVSNHRKILGKRLIDGDNLVEVVKENPELLFCYASLKNNLQLFR